MSRCCVWMTAFLMMGLLAATEAKAADDGFVSLVDAELSAWETEGNWTVKDGVISITPRPGESGWKRYGSYLWLKQSQKDFVLSLEFKLPPKGNSGIYLRVQDTANPVYTGKEVQILDSHGKQGKLTPHDGGGLVGLMAASKNANRPAGEWNKMVITCRGSQVNVVLNGEQIIDFDMGDAEQDNTGAIGLQDHGLPLEFRAVKIKAL